MNRLLQTALVLFLAGCATQPALAPEASATATPPCNGGDVLINASLWVQSSAEYRANALQVYGAARRAVDAAITSATAGSKPPAVILDADETSILNIPYEARMIRRGTTYESDAWKQWVNESAASAVPGASEFLSYVHSRGVTAFFITNRRQDEEAGTRRNLERLGYPLRNDIDTLLTRGERPEWDMSDKTSRRNWVASQYRVVAILGDDLNDFIFAAGKSAAEREALVRDNAARFGTEWFILPNPMYGSWEDALIGEAKTPCEKRGRKIELLQTK